MSRGIPEFKGTAGREVAKFLSVFQREVKDVIPDFMHS
jgi:hypothetical protein